MKISIGSDHRGFELKSRIMRSFGKPFEWFDKGCVTPERSDYPVYAKAVCQSIHAHESSHGILICGSGAGMAMAANRSKKIYAALCWNKASLKAACNDDNMNILVLSADLVAVEENIELITYALILWQEATFKGGRYAERLAMIDNIS